MGHRVLHPHLKKVLPHAGQLQKVLVAPDDLSGVGPEDHDGQRRVDEGGLAGGVHAAGDVVDILHDVLAALLVAAAKIGVQRRGGHALHQRQKRADGHGGQGKDHQKEEVQL